MSQDGWPAVGQQSISLAAHAASVRVDIERLRDCIRKGANSVPKEVFEEFSSSVDVLVDKILDLHDYSAIEKSIKRIDHVISTMYSAQHPPSIPAVLDDAVPVVESTFVVEAAPKTSEDEVTNSRTSSKLILRPRHLIQSEKEQITPLYQRLDILTRQIRLVKINPQPHPAFGINCELVVIALEDHQQDYKALSYVWGDAKDTQPILLNGRRFDVTQNLKRALVRLRAGGIIAPIWIDAISINQADTEERNQQVRLMRHIYEKTSEVIVYLGEHAQSRWTSLPSEPSKSDRGTFTTSDLCTWAGDDDDASRIETILAHAQNYADRFPEPPRPDFEPLDLLVCLLRLLAGHVHLSDIPLLKNNNILKESMTALNFLVVQPWWTRIWVVQETILPPKVVALYGRHSAPLYMFVNAAEQLKLHLGSCCTSALNLQPSQASTIAVFIQKMSTIAQSWSLRQNESTVNLPTLLQLYHSRDATDPRDKVYGLLGLVDDWGSALPIEPEYDIKCRELYENFAQSWSRITGSLDFLSFGTAIPSCKAHQNEALDAIFNRLHATGRWPTRVQITSSTWAPDWNLTSEPQSIKAIADRTARYPLFNAALGQPASCLWNDRLFVQSQVLTPAAILTIEGYRVGEIGIRFDGDWFISPILTQAKLVNEFLRIDRNGFWTEPYLPFGKQHGIYNKNALCTNYDALCRALIADCWVDSEVDSHLPLGEQTFRRASEHDVLKIKIWREWKERHKSSDQNLDTTPSRSEFTHERVYQRTIEADRALRSATHLRCFVTTDTGFVGLAPKGAREGDVIMVFMGARVPYLVRRLGRTTFGSRKDRKTFASRKEQATRTASDEDIWAIIGECYLIGAMDGEIVKYYQAHEESPEVIHVI